MSAVKKPDRIMSKESGELPVQRTHARRIEGGVVNTALAIDRKLHATAPAAGKGYDLDALNIAKVLVKHYGDEAESVLKRVGAFLDEARRAKR